MTNVDLTCGYCGIQFQRCKKEIDRQHKRRRTTFFCNRSCSARSNPGLMRGNPNNLYLGGGRKKDKFTGFREHLRRARRRGKEYQVTLDELVAIWESQDGRCAYTGIPLIHPHYKEIINPICQASLDRIDSSQGYTATNLQFVCMPMNFAKSSFSDSIAKEFVDMIRKS